MASIEDAKILIMATDGFEQSELFVPMERLRDRGAEVVVASLESGRIKGWDHDDWGDSVAVDLTLDRVDVDEYDALILPGGQINPDLLRVEPRALEILRGFLDRGKVVAAICHAPWLLIEAGAVRGLRLTSYRSIRTDVRNAGGNWVDEEAVADNGIVTARNPGDLGPFVDKIVETIEEGRRFERKAA